MFDEINNKELVDMINTTDYPWLYAWFHLINQFTDKAINQWAA